MTRHDDALAKAAAELFLTITAHKSAADAIGFYWEDVPAATRAPWEKASKALVAVYEAHMSPEVATIAELDALPVETVVRDSSGDVYERWNSVSWFRIGDDESGRGDMHLPARVLHWGDA